jgi:hypothetical protein
MGNWKWSLLASSGLMLVSSVGANTLTNFPIVYPDVGVSMVAINYDASTYKFTATGLPTAYSPDKNTTVPAIGGTFSLTAYIDHTGHFLSGGTYVNNLTVTSPTNQVEFQSSRLFEFGAGPNQFEFQFWQDSGSLNPHNYRDGVHLFATNNLIFTSLPSNLASRGTTVGLAGNGDPTALDPTLGSNANAFAYSFKNSQPNGTADSFAPLPSSLAAGMVLVSLIPGLGWIQMLRRYRA